MSHNPHTCWCRIRHCHIAGLWLSLFISQLNVTQSGTGAGSTYLYIAARCRIRLHDIHPGSRIVLLIYIQCGAGSDTTLGGMFLQPFMGSFFLTFSGDHLQADVEFCACAKSRADGTGCVFVIPRTREITNTTVRARRPDTRQAPHGHTINCEPVHHFLFFHPVCACAKSPARNARRCVRKV